MHSGLDMAHLSFEVTSLHFHQPFPYPFFMSKGSRPDSNQATYNWIVPLPSEDWVESDKYEKSLLTSLRERIPLW